MIRSCNLPKDANIIVVGGGESRLVDHLLDERYTRITVLDISATALEKAKKRLGARSGLVQWIVSDITRFQPSEQYDLWHDRATFHFLTNADEINSYRNTVVNAVKKHLLIGTFSSNGPTKCSGLTITQYDEQSLPDVFEGQFEKIGCFTEDHITPFGTTQNFLFCRFQKKNRMGAR